MVAVFVSSLNGKNEVIMNEKETEKQPKKKTVRVAIIDEKTWLVANVALFEIDPETALYPNGTNQPDSLSGYVFVELRDTDHVGPGFVFDFGKSEFLQPTGEASLDLAPEQLGLLAFQKTFIPLSERIKQILSLGIYSPRSRTIEA